MTMSRRIFSSLAALILALFPGISSLAADEGTYSSYSPYSVFALGDIAMPGTAYNRSMAGVGIASRNNRFINSINPAAISARDSLAFMVDFSVFGENKIYAQGSNRSVNNCFNIGDCIISFPIWRSLSMMVGIMPYSNTGFDYKYSYTDTPLLADYGSVAFASNGIGSIYQLFGGLGATFFKRLSVGAEVIYYFGNIKKTDVLTFAASDRQNIETIHTAELKGLTSKLGLQYEIPLKGSSNITFGATYKFGAPVRGTLTKAINSTSSETKIDTLANTPGRLKFADELGFGVAYKMSDKLRFEVDFTRSDWTSSGFGTDPFFALQGTSAFNTGVSSAIRAGIEFVPNRNDVRYYFKRVAYRAGFYHSDDYYTVSGNRISANGITLGVTLPIYRWYNGLTIGLDFGRRGTITDNLVRETYFNFSVAVNLFDIWFQKPKYD